MSKRLQVLFDPKEYKKLSDAAKRSGLSVGEWVRRAIRSSLKYESARPSDEKLRVIHALSKNEFPIGDIDSILNEIESGRRK